MTGIKKYQFPLRQNTADLSRAYSSAAEAFACRDYLYTSRFADNPELRGHALLMLGNRVGGERILDAGNVRSPESCFYRAYAAWQHGSDTEARHWISEARVMGSMDQRLDRLAALMERQSFKLLFHWDIHNVRLLEPFKTLPGVEIVVTRHLPAEGARKLPFGQPLKDALPPGFKLDLILLDDLKMTPVGVGNLGAPVVVLIHDIEWYYELLPHLLPEIDLLSCGSTTDVLEAGRAFNATAATYFFPPHLSLPQFSLSQSLENTSNRNVDIFYSGSLSHDFYRYKKQEVLALTQLNKKFKIKLEDKFYPIDALWKEMRQARFSVMSSRTCNNVASRAIESVSCGTLHLIEEENGIPYLFSEKFDCFPAYRHESIVEDVNRHLRNYDNLIAMFRAQLPRFDAELQCVAPADATQRALRYLRYVLFMIYVEGSEKKGTPYQFGAEDGVLK